jgi:hypothetical protein
VYPPRKIHLAHDQHGAMIGRTNRRFANTLCKMNSDVPSSHITTDHSKVTCKICRGDRRFNAPQRTPVSSGDIKWRHRINWRGKLVLQVKLCGKWRDATLPDLNLNVV